ncbi:hypothetical protein Tco_1379107 [Tanacetum coccineum]
MGIMSSRVETKRVIGTRGVSKVHHKFYGLVWVIALHVTWGSLRFDLEVYLNWKTKRGIGSYELESISLNSSSGFVNPGLDFAYSVLLLVFFYNLLSTTVKLWTRNLVIRQRVEDFQLGIERFQTQLNLTKPGWDATGYQFKHDYTIIESPRAVVFPIDKNDRKIIRFNEIYKFSDGTLTRILEALDYRVKEFKVKRLNPGMNTRFWTEKDVTMSREFIAAIERRLKTRRIYQNLECFVGGRVRDIDYRLLQRTK